MDNVKFFYIQSETEPDKQYTIRVFRDTKEVRCDCPGFIFSGHCKHISQVLEQFEKKNE